MGVIGRPDKQGNIEKYVKDMRVGEKGYIFAWGISFDTDLRPHLNLKTKVTKRKDGDSDKIPIVRTGQGEADYIVDIRKTKYNWETEKEPFSEYEWNEREIVQLPYDSHTRKKIKVSPRKSHRKDLGDRLKANLQMAVKTEEYELAARLRDDIQRLNKS